MQLETRNISAKWASDSELVSIPLSSRAEMPHIQTTTTQPKQLTLSLMLTLEKMLCKIITF